MADELLHPPSDAVGLVPVGPVVMIIAVMPIGMPMLPILMVPDVVMVPMVVPVSLNDAGMQGRGLNLGHHHAGGGRRDMGGEGEQPSNGDSGENAHR